MSSAGDQVPLIPLSETNGNASKVSPSQMSATCVKIGVACALTVMEPDTVGFEQPPVVINV